MLSGEDLERFYFQYQTEAVPLGMSVQTFCLRNNVPYNIFHKWYKDTRKRIVRIQMDGIPPEPVLGRLPSSELFSKISLMGVGITLTWFLTKSLWLSANVKFKTN